MISVLYVGDEPGLLEAGKLFLKADGEFVVNILNSALEALIRLKTVSYDVIISDYRMPVMDGIAFLKALRASGNTTPFILFTGREREDILFEALREGADFSIRKDGDLEHWFPGFSHKIRQAVSQRHAEDMQRECEARFRDIADSISDLIVVMDPHGYVTYMSPSVLPVLGFPYEEYVGKKACANVIFSEDVQKVDQAIERLKKGSLEEQVEFRIKKSNGSYAGFDGTLIPVLKNGIYSGVEVVARTISGRKQAEEELRAAYEQLAAREEELRAEYDSLTISHAECESTFNAISDWIALITPAGRIFCTNNAIESLLGIPSDQVLGRNCFEFFYKTQSLPDDYPLIRMLESKKRESTEIQMRDVNRWFQVTVDPVINSSGILVSAVHIVRDITERTRSQKALEQAKSKLNLLNYVMFNDIQNMIFTLSGYQHLIKGKIKESPARSIIEKQGVILQNITHSLKFAHSFQDLGLKPPQWQNANYVFLMAISHLDFLNIKHTVLLDGLEIFADPLLERVFQILAENVLMHGQTATRVTFRYVQGPEFITLFFEDDGVGIPGNIKKDIFLPDFQKSRNVGLFLAREILEITGITITETGNPDTGARFEMKVPKGMWRRSGEHEISIR
jgi:PAS domain S-box-containing protein